MGADEFPFRYSDSHLGNRWGLWETGRLQFPIQAAGVLRTFSNSWDSKGLYVFRRSTWGVLGFILDTETYSQARAQWLKHKRQRLSLSIRVPLWPVHWPSVIRTVSEVEKIMFQHEASFGVEGSDACASKQQMPPPPTLPILGHLLDCAQ